MYDCVCVYWLWTSGHCTAQGANGGCVDSLVAPLLTPSSRTHWRLACAMGPLCGHWGSCMFAWTSNLCCRAPDDACGGFLRWQEGKKPLWRGYRAPIHPCIHDPCIHASMHACIHASMHPCIHPASQPAINPSIHSCEAPKPHCWSYTIWVSLLYLVNVCLIRFCPTLKA